MIFDVGPYLFIAACHHVFALHSSSRGLSQSSPIQCSSKEFPSGNSCHNFKSSKVAAAVKNGGHFDKSMDMIEGDRHIQDQPGGVDAD